MPNSTKIKSFRNDGIYHDLVREILILLLLDVRSKLNYE